ncbi:MAG: tripartite tricarboxylate transporter substrate binding protein [Geminicoccaceae bacterium]|nr:MAG: tripartite tricarboxylate transporter substrate binding protein [Geminicoccaceae bacterium]
MRLAIATAALAAFGLASIGSAAAEYPERPVRVIVPSPAGGSTDVGTRILADAIEAHLGQRWVIENRPGAGLLIGMQALADAEPDGYTLGYTHQPFLTVHIYVNEADFTFDSFEPVALLVDDPNTVAVRVDSPFESLEDLIAAMRERPGEITFGDTGYLSDDHLVTVAIERAFGVEANAVHYDGSAPLRAAVLGGHVDVYVGNVGDTKVTYDEGQFRVLAVATEERIDAFPNTPTFRELGVDLVASSARGVSFPAGTPTAYADRMAEAIAAASQDEDYLRRMAEQGLAVRVLTREEYGAFQAQRMEFVRGLLEALGEL